MLFRSHLQITICLGMIGAGAAAASDADLEFFEKRVRPVLSAHCYECHSVDAEKLKADLLLDSRESVLRGGDSGPSIVVGKPDESLLITSVRYTDVDLQMPPKTRLSDEQVSDLARWIEIGAPWPDEPPPEAGKRRDAFDLDARRAAHWCWQPMANDAPNAGHLI